MAKETIKHFNYLYREKTMKLVGCFSLVELEFEFYPNPETKQ